VTIGGAADREMAFDTGSSTLALFTSPARWQAWTGRQPDDPRNPALEGKSWANAVALPGAPLKGRLCAGKACLADPLIFCAPRALPNLDLDHAPYRISGILGNRLFDGRFTGVIDLPHRRFGLLEGALDCSGG
jgi:hypothetical protein